MNNNMSSDENISSDNSSDLDYVEERQIKRVPRKTRSKNNYGRSVFFQSLLSDHKTAPGRAVAALAQKTSDAALIEGLDILLQSGGASTQALLADDVLTTSVNELAEGITATVQVYDCPLTSYIIIKKDKIKLTPLTRMPLWEVFPNGVDSFFSVFHEADLTNLTVIGALNPIAQKQTRTFVLPIFQKLWAAIGREFESVFRGHSKRLLELLALLTDSECRTFRIAATVAACGLAEGFLAHRNTAKIDEERYMVQLASADISSDVAKTLQSHIDECKGIQNLMHTHFEAIRLSVINLRVRDKDVLLRWIALEALCRFVLMEPSLILADAQPLGFALYDRSSAIRRTAALCLAVASSSQSTASQFGNFVSFFLTRLSEMPLDTDLWVAAFSILFLSSIELSEETTDSVVETLWGADSLLNRTENSPSLSSHKAFLKALAIFIDNSTFACSVFGHENLTDETCLLLLNTVVEFLKEFAYDKWPLYDIFVSAFWERCTFLQRIPTLLEIVTVKETSSSDEKYMLPVIALAFSAYKHLEVSINTNDVIFAVDPEEVETWLKRSTLVLLEKGPILLQVTRPYHTPFTLVAALLVRALLHIDTVKDLISTSSLETLTQSLVASFQACHQSSPCLDNLATAIGLIEDLKSSSPLTSLLVGTVDSLKEALDREEPGQSEPAIALLMRKLLAVLKLCRVNPATEMQMLSLPDSILRRYMKLTTEKSSHVLGLGFVLYHLCLCYEALSLQSKNKKRRHSDAGDFSKKLSRWRSLVREASHKAKNNAALQTVVCFAWLGSKRFLHGLFGDDLEENYGFAFGSTPEEINMIISLAQAATGAVEQEQMENTYDPLVSIVEKESPEKRGHSFVCPYGRFGIIDDLLDDANRDYTKLDFESGWSILYYLVLEIESHALLDKPLLASSLIPLFLSLLTLKCPTYTDAVRSFLNSMCAFVDPSDTFNAVGRSIFVMLSASQRRTTAKDLAKQLAAFIPPGYLLQNPGTFRKFITDALKRKGAVKSASRECLSHFINRLVPSAQAELQTYLLTKFPSETVESLFRRKL